MHGNIRTLLQAWSSTTSPGVVHVLVTVSSYLDWVLNSSSSLTRHLLNPTSSNLSNGLNVTSKLNPSSREDLKLKMRMDYPNYTSNQSGYLQGNHFPRSSIGDLKHFEQHYFHPSLLEFAKQI